MISSEQNETLARGRDSAEPAISPCLTGIPAQLVASSRPNRLWTQTGFKFKKNGNILRVLLEKALKGMY